MKFSRHVLPLLPLLLAACAHAPQPVVQSEVPVSTQQESVAPEPLNLPKVPLDAQTLYEFLLGDIANQRGNNALAAQAYFDLAKRTRDPRVARRAAQLAFESRDLGLSENAFRLWQEIEPASPMARLMLAMMLLGEGKLKEARPLVEAMLAAEPDKAGAILVQVQTWLVRAPNKGQTADFLIELTHPYPKVAEGHLVVAQAALAAKREAVALHEAHEAVQLKPDWDTAVMFEAQVMMRNNPDQALASIGRYLDGHSDNQEVRLFYARALLEQKHYAEARNEFQSLQKIHPDNAELAFAIALISLELGEFDRAEKELKQTLAAGKKDESTVYYYLAQLSEAKKDDVAALAQYARVTSGEYAYSSRLREAYLLNKTGKLNEAREILHHIDVPNDQQRVNLLLIEAQMLREAKSYAETFAVLMRGLDKYPNHPALLYEAAMAADKIGKLPEFEKLMRKLLQIAPENAHAYNALGYSLLERKVRLEEAMKLVEKAYQLAPDDAAITDSMGWGYFLLGNVNKSIEFLRRAFAANPDPEIAAHLGEALWAQGGKDEAKKIWQDSLKSNPDSEILRAVIKRFMP